MEQGLRFAVISAYPDEDWHSQRIVAAAGALGDVDVISPDDVGLIAEVGRCTVTVRGLDARGWDVWLTPRALGDHGDPDVQCGLYRALSELDAPVVNPVGALLDAEDKIRTSWLLARAGIPTPPARVVQGLDEAEAALSVLGQAVVKPPYGSLGLGIGRVASGEPDARELLAQMVDKHGVAYLQRYVAPRGPAARDLRLFVVGRRIAGAMERVAPPGEFRTNVHQGGEARGIAPPPAAAKIAVAATRALRLEYAGIDLVEDEDGWVVLEVNGTPRWEGLLGATGKDMAEEIVRHAAAVARRKARRQGTREERFDRWLTGRASRVPS